MILNDDQLYELILSNNIVDEKKLKELVEEGKLQKTPLWEMLVDGDFITDENLGVLISDSLHLPFISLGKISIQPQVLRIIPEVVARKQKIIVFAQDKDGVRVGMANPNDQEIQQLIAKKTSQPVMAYFATERDIDTTLKLYQQELQKGFDELMAEHIAAAKLDKNNELPVARIVDDLLIQAFRNKASDIHIEPTDEISLIRFRMDGVLHDMLRLPRDLHDQVVSRIKVLSRLRTDEHLSAQDGKIHFASDDQEFDIRVSIVPIVDGEKIVMRLLASKSKQLSIRDLGLSDADYEKLLNGIKKPHGMILSTGPTGSGKSTSIYSMIKIINTRERNIATIEDPVEYQIPGVNQIQVNTKTNLTFANGLRALLRQDPDIVFVGEIRDDETASIAINSAMTGHLVFSTLHTNDAATTLPRLMDMHIEPFLVASTVNVIIGQRLVRRICEQCRVSTQISNQQLRESVPAWVVDKHSGKKNLRAYIGKGCSVCHFSGYVGRIGIFEVMEVSQAIQELITAKTRADVINQKAIDEGMTTMLEDGLDKVEKGLTTLEEVVRVTKT